MLAVDGAHRLIAVHLGETPRAVHSRLVGRLMRRLAEHLDADPLLWELTGLCHDLDFVAVAGDWSRHGLLTADWLRDELPAEALDAIRSHDHRTGVSSSTPVANALKLADALAVASDQLGVDLVIILGDGGTALADRLGDRPYLPNMIFAFAASLGISLPTLGKIAAASVPPD